MDRISRTMDCDQARDLLSDYLGGAVEEAEAAAVSAHLAACPACAAEAEGLRELSILLRGLPAMKAPPELLGRISASIACAKPATPLWRALFLPAHVKIPLEAAAALILFLLVYGIPGGTLRTDEPGGRAPAPATRAFLDADRTAAGSPAATGKTARKGASTAAGKAARKDAPAAASRETETGTSGIGRSDAEVPEPASPLAEFRARSGRPAPARPAARRPSFLPPATLVSSAEERVGSTSRPEEFAGGKPAEEPVPSRIFAAPPSRLLKALPYGREVVLVVSPEKREGAEERIADAAVRAGGRPADLFPIGPGAVPEARRSLRVLVPADSAEGFLADLRTLGTIPPEGMPGSSDIPAGPAPGVIAYTIHIRTP